jgi:integrase/recombinase XerD
MNIRELIPEYRRYLWATGKSPCTIRNASYALKDFQRYLEAEGISELTGLTQEVMVAYQLELSFRLTGKGGLLGLRSQVQLLGVARSFTKYLTDNDYLAHDPGAALRLPKKPKRLPKVILNSQELSQLMHAPDMRTNRGYRNRIILELLYDTGIRRAEVASIRLSDLDLESGYILIHGKGNKERVVPVCGRVCDLMRSYIELVRPSFLLGRDEGFLVLNRWGAGMDVNGIWAAVKRCVRLARLQKNVSPHTFRHTCATHMLKNGAPIRHVQELLGHESLESTQIYTRITINDLKEIHARCHPGETLD